MTDTPRLPIALTVTRAIAASPAEVYDAWLDAQSPGSPWFGTAKAIVHPVVDGLFYHVVQFEGHDWAHYGRFVALDRPSRIEHTWVSEATRGMESVVALTLTRLSQLTWKFENLTSWRPAQPIDRLGATAAERQHSVCGADQVELRRDRQLAESRGMFLRHKIRPQGRQGGTATGASWRTAAYRVGGRCSGTCCTGRDQ